MAYTIQNVDSIPDAELIPEVVSRLETIQTEVEKKYGRHDGLACFNHLYTVITKSVQADSEKAGAAGGFQDKAFITRLDAEFANRYFRALDAEGTPAGMPAPWNALVKSRGTRHISKLMFAVVGVSAHVNFDLPFALLATARDHGGLVDGTRHADYQHVNAVFAKEMKQLRFHFEDPFERACDTSYISKVENLIGDAVVVFSRNRAWSQAVNSLWPCRDDAAAQQRLEASAASQIGWINRGLLMADNHFGHAVDLFESTTGLVKARPARG